MNCDPICALRTGCFFRIFVIIPGLSRCTFEIPHGDRTLRASVRSLIVPSAAIDTVSVVVVVIVHG